MLYSNKMVTTITILSLWVLFSGCTAQPLYRSENTGMVALEDRLSTISLDEAKDRDTQILRNQLIYLMKSGQTPPEMMQYQLSLTATTQTIATVRTDIGDKTDRTGRPSAGTIQAHADYVLRDREGKILTKGKRSMTAPFDRPRQEYANLRAEEDAKKRALEELAFQILSALAHDLSKIPALPKN